MCLSDLMTPSENKQVFTPACTAGVYLAWRVKPASLCPMQKVGLLSLRCCMQVFIDPEKKSSGGNTAS
jgi:hypothetical protein